MTRIMEINWEESKTHDKESEISRETDETSEV
jgi:hypothetical protein